MRPRPRVPGKPNPAMTGYQSPTPTQEANSRQMVPNQLASRAAAAQAMFRSGKNLMYRKGNAPATVCGVEVGGNEGPT